MEVLLMDINKLKEQFVEWYNKDKGSNTYWGMHIHLVFGLLGG